MKLRLLFLLLFLLTISSAKSAEVGLGTQCSFSFDGKTLGTLILKKEGYDGAHLSIGIQPKPFDLSGNYSVFKSKNHSGSTVYYLTWYSGSGPSGYSIPHYLVIEWGKLGVIKLTKNTYKKTVTFFSLYNCLSTKVIVKPIPKHDPCNVPRGPAPGCYDYPYPKSKNPNCWTTDGKYICHI